MSTIDLSINSINPNTYVTNRIKKMTWQNLSEMALISFIKNPKTRSKNHSTTLQQVNKQVLSNQTNECDP